jgi:hypothetical protein
MFRARRSILLLLLIGASVAGAAQVFDARLDEALNPETAPGKRLELLDQILATEGGAAALAERGLSPKGDPEVVHAVVDALIRSDQHLDHLERICLLLVAEDGMLLRRKVARRLLRAGEHPEKAAALIGRLRDLALGVAADASSNPELRLGAIRVLGRIPQRAAVALVIEAWSREEKSAQADADVIAACREALAHVVPGRTATDARTYFDQRLSHSYFDLRDEVSNRRLEELQRLRGSYYQSLKAASASAAFDALSQADPLGREHAAERIRTLAASGKTSDLKPEEFAKRAFAAFAEERRRSPIPSVAAVRLTEAMADLGKTGKSSPLLKAVGAKEVAVAFDALAREAGAGEAFGLAAVRLLKSIGPEGIAPLFEYARRFRKSSNVRIEAIRALADRAGAGGDNRAMIGAGLAKMLERVEQPAVRRQLLFSLKQAAVPQAFEAIRNLLLPPEGTDPKLAAIEAKDCIAILQQIATPEALSTLLEVAEKHPDLKVRRDAVIEGLLPRAQQANGEEATVLDYLRRIVLSKDQDKGLRKDVVAGLADRGGRGVYPLLRALESDAGLEEDLRQAASAGKLRLAERLAAPAAGATASREDLATATAILGEEVSRGDPARLKKLADRILATGAARKIPTGNARALLAKVCARMPNGKAEEILAAYQDAVDNAKPDGLAQADEIALRLRYRELLLAGKPDPVKDARAVQESLRLAELTAADKPRSAGYLLDAAQYATERLKNRPRADEILAQAEKLGPFSGALATRLAEIRAATAELPAPG